MAWGKNELNETSPEERGGRQQMSYEKQGDTVSVTKQKRGKEVVAERCPSLSQTGEVNLNEWTVFTSEALAMQTCLSFIVLLNKEQMYLELN